MLSDDLGFRILKHSFGGGVYCKLMEIDDGREVPTHKHKFDHLSTLFSGCCIVEAEGQQETYYAPDVITIKAGVVHSILAVNGPVVWGCIHATDETDEANIDETLIEPVKHMQKAKLTLNVDSALAEINRHPELWNKHTMRTESPTSPHRDVDDIWLRYKDTKLPVDQQSPHDSVWYPAIRSLPGVRRIVDSIALSMPKGTELGGVLITRISPGRRVHPHSDRGTWHSEYFNKKILVLLQSAPNQRFNFADESHEGVAGEVFSFDNMPEHWVTNDSDEDRVSLLISLRTPPNE